MPSLKVAFVCRTNSSSGMPRNCMKSTNDGMVASPTPIVPISSDSISTTSQSVLCRTRARQAAVTHPAVPPPTMTTRLIRFPSLTACYSGKRPRPDGGNPTRLSKRAPDSDYKAPSGVRYQTHSFPDVFRNEHALICQINPLKRDCPCIGDLIRRAHIQLTV